VLKDPLLRFLQAREKLMFAGERAKTRFYEPLIPKLESLVLAGEVDQDGCQPAVHEDHLPLFITGTDSDTNRLPCDFH
jgi:hypothetical protein